MTDGQGVPGVQPALSGSALVAGDPATLVSVLLWGPDAVLPAGRPAYPNKMPGYAFWSDEDVAAVLTHARVAFGRHSTSIAPAEVAGVRARRRP
jgi:mono/diheme cytochrome c family protein